MELCYRSLCKAILRRAILDAAGGCDEAMMWLNGTAGCNAVVAITCRECTEVLGYQAAAPVVSADQLRQLAADFLALWGARL